MKYKLLAQLDELLKTHTVKEVLDGLLQICSDKSDYYRELANHDADYYDQLKVWDDAKDILEGKTNEI